MAQIRSFRTLTRSFGGFQDKKVIRQHDGRHRSKDGTDEIEKVFKAAGVNGDGKECAKGRCDEGLSFFRKACCQGPAGYAR